MSTIFGNKKTQADEFAEITAPVFEGYDALDNGDLLALQESYDDQLEIVRHIHEIDSETMSYEADMATMESASDYEKEQRTEEYESVTEASVKNAWETIKTFFKNLWGKLKAFFASIVRYFDSLFRSAQGFVSKHENDLKKLVLDGYKYKMHKYSNLDAGTKIEQAAEIKGIRELYASSLGRTDFTSEAVIKSLRDEIEASKEAKEEILNGVRGAAVGKSALTPDQYKQALFGYFRGGAKSHDDREELPVKISEVISTIKNTNAKQRVSEFQKEVDAEFSNLIRRVDTAAKAVENNTTSTSGKTVHGGDSNERYHKTNIPHGSQAGGSRTIHYTANNRGVVLEGIRTLSTFVTAVKEIQLQSFRAWKEAWAERERTYRSVCMGAFRYKAK